MTTRLHQQIPFFTIFGKHESKSQCQTHKVTAQDHNFDLNGLKTTNMELEWVYLKYQSGRGSPVQTSKSVSVTIEGHAIQAFHDTQPESFSD